MKRLIISLMAISALIISNPLLSTNHGYPQIRPAGAMNRGIQIGDLIINNTLNEPLTWRVSTTLNGYVSGMDFKNKLASSGGYIPAHTMALLSSGFGTDEQLPSGGFKSTSIWGSTINLTLNGSQIQIQQPGTYVLSLDANDNFVLERQ